jgi:hypothetical protein
VGQDRKPDPKPGGQKQWMEETHERAEAEAPLRVV